MSSGSTVSGISDRSSFGPSILVLRENHSRSDHPPMTPIQCTAAVTSMMEFLDVAELAADVLVAGSTFLE